MLEGFQRSSTTAFEEAAAEAVHRQMLRTHGRARTLDIRQITSAEGDKREVDGVVLAGADEECAAVLEGKKVLDEHTPDQLASVLEFLRWVGLAGVNVCDKGRCSLHRFHEHAYGPPFAGLEFAFLSIARISAPW